MDLYTNQIYVSISNCLFHNHPLHSTSKLFFYTPFIRLEFHWIWNMADTYRYFQIHFVEQQFKYFDPNFIAFVLGDPIENHVASFYIFVGIEQAADHYLKQRWPSSVIHLCVTMSQCAHVYQLIYTLVYLHMMTSSNEIFSALLAMGGEFTGHRWIHLTKASDAELRCFLWPLPEQTVELTVKTPMIWYTIALMMTSL